MTYESRLYGLGNSDFWRSVAEGWKEKAEKAEPQWRPINTAPQDGSKLILGAWSGDSYANVCIAGLEPVGSMQGDTTKPRAIFGMSIFYPTHWMPVPPKPPKE